MAGYQCTCQRGFRGDNCQIDIQVSTEDFLVAKATLELAGQVNVSESRSLPVCQYFVHTFIHMKLKDYQCSTEFQFCQNKGYLKFTIETLFLKKVFFYFEFCLPYNFVQWKWDFFSMSIDIMDKC